MRAWAAVLVAAAVLALDVLTKALVSGLPVGYSQPLLGQWVLLTHVRNSGAAFGMLAGRTGLFVALEIAVLVALPFALRLTADKWSLVAMGALMGGAAGNLLDRLRTGLVIDFIDLRFWPVFNVADSAIVAGVGILVLRLLVPPRRAAPGRET